MLILLQHDNARPHNSAVVLQYRISDVKLFFILATAKIWTESDFWFAPVKKHLKGINFTCDEAVPLATGKWFQEQPEEFYSVRFKKLVQYQQHCIKQEGDYVEDLGIPVETKYTP